MPDESPKKANILLLVSDPIVRAVMNETLDGKGIPFGLPETWGGPSIFWECPRPICSLPAPMWKACLGTMPQSIFERNAGA